MSYSRGVGAALDYVKAASPELKLMTMQPSGPTMGSRVLLAGVAVGAAYLLWRRFRRKASSP